MARSGRWILSVLLASGALVVSPPSHAVPGDTFPETRIIDPANVDGITTFATLQAGGLYRITASGRFVYRSDLYSDAECTQNPFLAIAAALTPLPELGWFRYGHFFVGLNHEDFITTIPWDLDPTDDATDLYIDDRNVEWVPTSFSATALGCSRTNSYETLFVPLETRPVQIRVFDLWYIDNANDPAAPLTVRISRVAEPPLPSLAHVQTVLAHTRDPDGSNSLPLTPGQYLLVAHGSYLYELGGPLGHELFADAECSRGPTGAPDGLIWRRERFGPSKLDLLVGGGEVTWLPWAPSTDLVCDSLTHFYYTVMPLSGTVTFKVEDDSYGDNVGTLSVEIFKLL